MLFNSYLFIVLFLPLGAVAYWFLTRSIRPRQICLLVLNLVFYNLAGPGPMALLLTAAAVTYLATRYLISAEATAYRRLGLLIGISNLAVLVMFKLLQTSPTLS